MKNYDLPWKTMDFTMKNNWQTMIYNLKKYWFYMILPWKTMDFAMKNHDIPWRKKGFTTKNHGFYHEKYWFRGDKRDLVQFDILSAPRATHQDISCDITSKADSDPIEDQTGN